MLALWWWGEGSDPPRLTQARVGMLGRGRPPGPVAMGRAAALAPRSGGVMLAAAAGRPGTGGTAGSVAVALAAAPHPCGRQPCGDPQLEAQVAGHYPGAGAGSDTEGDTLWAPQDSRPRGSAPK